MAVTEVTLRMQELQKIFEEINYQFDIYTRSLLILTAAK